MINVHSIDDTAHSRCVIVDHSKLTVFLYSKKAKRQEKKVQLKNTQSPMLFSVSGNSMMRIAFISGESMLMIIWWLHSIIRAFSQHLSKTTGFYFTLVPENSIA